MQFKRILFPVDFSDHSKTCLETSSRLSVAEAAEEIHFLYVLHTPTDFSTWEGNPQEEVHGKLREFIRDFAHNDQVNVKSAVATGHPSTEICKHAAHHGCDVIVMATHGRTGLAHMLLGSTAEQVVRHAPCPVLTVRVSAS